MEETVETQLQHVSAIIEIAAEFAIAYGLQIIGALVILFIGLKFAAFVGRRITGIEAETNPKVLARVMRGALESLAGKLGIHPPACALMISKFQAER